MTTGRRVVYWLYSALIRLYPVGFYTEFHREMLETFHEVLTSAESSVTQLSIRELRDLPLGILREHRRVRRAKRLGLIPAIDGTINDRLTGHPPPSGSWKDSLLAGLPHFLLALLFGVNGLHIVRDQRTPDAQSLVPLVTGAIILGIVTTLLVVLFAAWRKGWPLWSASWYLYVVLPILSVPIGYLQHAAFARASRLDEAAIYVAVPLVLGLLFYLLLRRDRFMALLAVLPLVVLLWMPVLEFVPSPLRDELTVAAWLFAGLTAIVCVRLGSAGTAVWLALGMNLLIGLPYAYARTYLWVSPRGAAASLTNPPTVLAFVNTFAPPFLGIATLILGPALIWRLRHVGRMAGTSGIRDYRLAALGFTYVVVGNLAAYWWMLSHWPSGDYLAFRVVVYGGLALFLFGSIPLVVRKPTRRRKPGAASSTLLVLVLLSLPPVLMLPLLLGMRSMPDAMPLAFLHLHDSRLMAYALGCLWLMLAGWLAARPVQSKTGPRPPLGLLVAALATVLPIVVLSLYPALDGNVGWSPPTPILFSYGILLAGIAVAWFAGFPRWSYLYVGLILVVSSMHSWDLNRWLWARLEDVGLGAGAGNIPGWLAWTPLLILLVILSLITRSARPLGRFFTGIKEDWTRLSFALYGVLVWWFPATTGDNHNPYLTVGLAIMSASLIWGAFAYTLQDTRRQRILALLAGLTIAWLVTDVINATYWIGRPEPWMQEPLDGRSYPITMMAGWAVLIVIILLPSLPGRMRRSISGLRMA